MAVLRVNENLFLESLELNRLVEFLDVDGFRAFLLDNTVKYGLVKKAIDSTFTNGLVENGTNVRTIKHREIRAIDSNGQVIYKELTDNISVPNDGNWYWVKIKYITSSQEVGTVTIDINGNLVGTATKFTEVLRGQPNFPSRVRFIGSTLNTLEYEVLEVINNLNAILQGNFQAETNLGLSVVGTFTPGVNPPETSKNIFQYDSCTFSLVRETITNTRPSFTEGTEFFIARVKASGSVCLVQDKRTEIWTTKANYFLKNVEKSVNPLIGIESLQYDNLFTPRDRNITTVAWNFRSSNFTIDPSTNKVTINAGQGGKFKTTSNFTSGDFDGWRLYTNDGSFAYISSSIKSGSQINLTLDHLDVDKYSIDGGTTFITQELIVAPDADSIEFVLEADIEDSVDVQNEVFRFNINERIGQMRVLVFDDPSCLWNVKYRYKHIDDYSSLLTLPSDSSGYYAESQYDADNDLIPGAVRTPYTSSTTQGFITLTLAPNAYANQISGDALGVDYKTLTNLTPVLDLIVGTDRQHQVLTASGGILTLTGNYVINLKSGIHRGNTFFLYISALVKLSTFTFAIRQNYISASTPGTLIKSLTQLDLDGSTSATYTSLCIKAVWDGTNWLLTLINDANGPWYVIGSTVELAFKNSWVASSTGPAMGGVAFRKNRLNKIEFMGGATKVSADATVIFTLPVGYRPATYSKTFVCSRFNLTATSHIRIDTDGNVYNLTAAATPDIDFSQVSFYLD